MNKVLLVNPKSAEAKFRIPNSILNIAASVNHAYEWTIVDGNREADISGKIRSYLDTGHYKYIGFTLMPGPQAKQAILLSRMIREEYPNTIMIWGGYFPSNHYKVVLNSGKLIRTP